MKGIQAFSTILFPPRLSVVSVVFPMSIPDSSAPESGPRPLPTRSRDVTVLFRMSASQRGPWFSRFRA